MLRRRHRGAELARERAGEWVIGRGREHFADGRSALRDLPGGEQTARERAADVGVVADARPPAFVWCQKTGHNHEPSLSRLMLEFRCFGADGALGAFAIDDWNVIAEHVSLNAEFFGPPSETCNLNGALNGPDATQATSFWECGGPTNPPFQFQAFGNGTGVSTATGAFTFNVSQGGCGFGKLSGGTFFHVLYSPSKDVLNLYETNAAVTQFTFNDCRRRPL